MRQILKRVEALERKADREILEDALWGAARIIETPGWGKLNRNRSVRHDE
jgi:hypothetical protein